MELCDDMWGIVLAILKKDDSVSTGMLACTCKNNWRLYMGACPDYKRRLYSLAMNIWAGEGNLAWDSRVKKNTTKESLATYWKEMSQVYVDKLCQLDYFVHVKTKQRSLSRVAPCYEKNVNTQ